MLLAIDLGNTQTHIGMFRDEVTHRPQSYYFKAPANLAEADVIVIDPMLATGWSATAAIAKLKEKYPTGALCTIRFNVTHWRQIAPGTGTLMRFLKPRDLAFVFIAADNVNAELGKTGA